MTCSYPTWIDLINNPSTPILLSHTVYSQRETLTMTTPPQVDKRLEKVEQVTIDFETFKKAFKYNYLGESNRHDRSYVLRLYPPFEAEMEAEYYESFQGQHYNNEWDEKPFHLTPELLILEGYDGVFNEGWPTEQTTRNHLTEDEIEDSGGIETAIQEGREIFWNEVKYYLPDEFDLGHQHGLRGYTVDIKWTNMD